MDKQENLSYLSKCLKEIEQRLGWGNSTEWHNNVFQELSENIQKETGILLSSTTLKRVWGKVAHNGAPSISTLNTLSQFAGYKNWRDFKIQKQSPKKTIVRKRTRPTIKVILLSIFIVVLLSTALFGGISLKEPEKELPDYSEVTFSSHPVVKGLPNSVVFNFDLGTIQPNRIKIQQSWDKTKTITVQPSQKSATAIYYYPGHFRTKLLVDDNIAKEHSLFIKSNDWLGTIDYEPIPKYIPFKELIGEKGLSFPQHSIDEITALEKIRRTSFHLVKDFGALSGDNFSLSTGIRNVYRDKWAVCQATNIVILGTEGAMIIPFSIPGCVSDLSLMLNDVYYDGKEHDLSAFGVDFSELRGIEVSVKNKRVTISVDSKEIYTGDYKESIGNLVGLRYRFIGVGTVEYVKLTDVAGNTVLNNNFTR